MTQTGRARERPRPDDPRSPPQQMSELVRQRPGLEAEILLERVRPVFPVEQVRRSAHALERVLGALVVLPGRCRIPVRRPGCIRRASRRCSAGERGLGEPWTPGCAERAYGRAAARPPALARATRMPR